MSADAREATVDDSRGPGPARTRRGVSLTPSALRGALALSAIVGAFALVLATVTTVIRIQVLTTVNAAAGLDTALSGSDRHGVALVLLAVFSVAVLFAGLRGLPAGFVALAVAGVVVLALAIISDARHIHEIRQIGDLYVDAQAGAGAGFYFETGGGALLLIAGGGLVVLALGPALRPTRSRKLSPPPQPAPPPEPAP